MPRAPHGRARTAAPPRRLPVGVPDLSAVPHSGAPAPSLMALQQAAMRLTGRTKIAGQALFAPIEGPLPSCTVYMKQVHEDDRNLMDVELVMRYIFTIGDRARWDLEGIVLEHGPILQNIILCNDHGGEHRLPRRNVDRFTTQGRSVRSRAPAVHAPTAPYVCVPPPLNRTGPQEARGEQHCDCQLPVHALRGPPR